MKHQIQSTKGNWTKACKCKECISEWNKQYYKTHKEKLSLYKKAYLQTPKGKAASMWRTIKYRLKHEPTYKNIKLLMTRDDFIKWAVPKIEEWVLTNPIEEVSLDRINNFKHYEISNLQLLTRVENIRKGNR